MAVLSTAPPAVRRRAEDQSLALLVHEFRTPLSTALQALEVLRTAAPGDPAGPRALDLVERQLRHLTRLADGALDLAQLMLRKLGVRREQIDLAQVVRAVAADRRAALERAGPMFTVEMTGEPLLVTGDATRLAQVLHHLLDNAAKFTDSGGRVAVQLAAADDRRRAVLVVKDTGVGIEPELLCQVFDLFVQAERARHRTRSGLGLDLALVKALIELHGGDVTAASAGAGHGAEFDVRLPLVRALEESPKTPERPPANQGGLCLFTWRNQGRRR
jgi:signal transduction histidine kinase